jgi:hypothetical protein
MTHTNPTTTPTNPLDAVTSPSKPFRCAKEPEIVLGVRMIWVHATHRRSGIASRLLDTARSTLVYGYIYPKHAIAFTQCTEEGFAFAGKYCYPENVQKKHSEIDDDTQSLQAILCYDYVSK